MFLSNASGSTRRRLNRATKAYVNSIMRIWQLEGYAQILTASDDPQFRPLIAAELLKQFGIKKARAALEQSACNLDAVLAELGIADHGIEIIG